MPEVNISPSSLQIDAQLNRFRGGNITPTIVCGLLSLETGELALVRSWGSLEHETPDEALRPVQTGVQPTESAPDAFIRKVDSELDIAASGLHTIYGIGSRRRVQVVGTQMRGKAFSLMCGTVVGRPELPSGEERGLLSAGWYTFDEAEAAFKAQVQRNKLKPRGHRNLGLLQGIRQLQLRLR